MREGQKRDFARHVRRNMTDAESHLWKLLRRQQLGERFRRQCPIDRYVVDFVCLRRKLIVEVDGDQHAGSSQDRVRDDCLVKFGYRVLRFWNNDVLENSEGVYGMIQIALSDSPHPDLPPQAGEGEEQVDHRLQPPHASDRKEKP
jgi:very-short-patch-repair endonuclease